MLQSSGRQRWCLEALASRHWSLIQCPSRQTDKDAALQPIYAVARVALAGFPPSITIPPRVSLLFFRPFLPRQVSRLPGNHAPCLLNKRGVQVARAARQPEISLYSSLSGVLRGEDMMQVAPISARMPWKPRYLSGPARCTTEAPLDSDAGGHTLSSIPRTLSYSADRHCVVPGPYL
jgi:hypothetical protein